MAQASTEIIVTPKQLGKHLREIRRRKGLSLSDVARGAGLSRRELVAYERGKLPIPESDLWVLAGSCGVDVSELVPATTSTELTVAARTTSVGDTVSQLRRSQEDAGISRHLHTLQKLQSLAPGKRIPVKPAELEEIATALGGTPRAIEQKLQEVLGVDAVEAARLRAMILVSPTGRGKPRAIAPAPAAIPAPAAPAAPPGPAPAPTAFAAPAPAAPAPSAPAAPYAPAAPSAAEMTAAEAAVAAAAAQLAPAPVQPLPTAPVGFLDHPLDAPIDPVHGLDVDVFEELARLPEPLPLGDPSAPLPDVLGHHDPFSEAAPLVGAPVGPPEGAVELVDSLSGPASLAASGTAAGVDHLAAWDAADAPPIDVAARQGSATWDLGEPPFAPPSAHDTALADAPTDAAIGWDTGWQPPPPEGPEGTPLSFWEGTDDWTPPAADTSGTTEVLDPDGLGWVVGADTWAGATWDANPWTPVSAASEGASSEGTATLDPAPWNSDAWPKESAERGAWEHQPDPAAVGSGFYVDWGTPDTDTPHGWDSRPSTPAPSDEVVEDAIEDAIDDIPAGATDTVDPTPYAELFAAEGAGQDTVDAGPGEVLETVDPTPYAELLDRTSTELVEDADADAAPPSFDQSYDADFDAPFESFEPPSASPFGTFDVAAPAPADELGAATDEVTDSSSIASYFGPFDEIEPFELPLPEATFSPVDEGALDAFDVLGADLPLTELPLGELAPISWHVEEDAADDSEPQLAPADDLVAAPQTVAATLTEWITAGADWQLGNAVPLVEVRNKGALVMRRADERWALADVTTTTDFEVEVEVDFRSGPGLGVLFRASVDGEGRMSGYSFDIDPIYDGGGYLVRQWHADRELWNPIARVAGGDPSSMYGPLTVRLALRGEELQATVNGEEVLIVDDLRAASAERGRDAAVGDRVGVQAWSSSDLVIDALRVAAR